MFLEKGIAYQDVDKLWPVVLDEIPPGRWGEQVRLVVVVDRNKNILFCHFILHLFLPILQICSLCDDIRYSRTGICIQCDAGLCKSYFHVTCAQKFGFLLDPAQAQVQVRYGGHFLSSMLFAKISINNNNIM